MTSTETPDLYVLRGSDTWANPYPAYKRLRDESPVHRLEHGAYGEFWVLSRFSDVFAAVRDTETFSSAQGLTPDPTAMDVFGDQAAPIVMMDPPDHTTMRRLVSRPMTPSPGRHHRDLRSPHSSTNDSTRSPAKPRSTSSKRSSSRSRASLLPTTSVVPVEDRTRFDGWTNAIVAANAAGAVTDAAEAALDLFSYATELIETSQD